MSSQFATPTERLAAFFESSPPRTTFEDSDIDEVARLLEQCEHIAAECPRTYILFPTIGHLDTLEQLVKVGFSDQWFHVETRTLPSFLKPSIRAAVVQQQGIILTKSLDLENGRHRHFTASEALPFEILGRLGSGGYGQVDRIRSKASFQLYALKRIRRRAAFGNASSQEPVKGFLNEMKIMRSLEHRHVVRYIGSYTDKSYLGLVMSPVADSDLAAYTERLCGYFETAPLFNIPTTDGKELFVSIPSLSALQLRDHPAALEIVTVWALLRSTLVRVGIAHVRSSIYVAQPTSDSQFSAVLLLSSHRYRNGFQSENLLWMSYSRACISARPEHSP
jgi:hypothetical protein